MGGPTIEIDKEFYDELMKLDVGGANRIKTYAIEVTGDAKIQFARKSGAVSCSNIFFRDFDFFNRKQSNHQVWFK